jgi:glycosyltransferase involved in cell wall biosynthesis
VRVIHVVTAFPRHAADPITPWLVELVRRQRAAGLHASVLAPAYRGGPPRGADGELDDAEAGSVAVVPVERFRYAPAPLETLTHDETVPDRLRRSPMQALLVPLYLLGGIRAARRVGRRIAPDIVHVHWPMPHALFGTALRRASGGRSAVVCSYYSVEVHWIRSRLPFLVPFLRWTARTADEVTAISSSTAAAVRTLVDRPVAVIPYGSALADDGSQPARPALSGPDEVPVQILFVGRLVERKGVEVLVRAIAEGQAEFPRPVELRIVGTGEWEDEIRAAIEAAGLDVEDVDEGEIGERDAARRSPEPSSSGFEEGAADGLRHRGAGRAKGRARVRLLGRASDHELRREYEAADIFVLPSVRDSKGDTEGLGVVLLEALRFERPVIGSDIGGIPDIIRHDETGVLCPPGDSRALATAIADLIRHPELARELARRGRARAAAVFGWNEIVAATTEAYERAVRARRTC